MEAGAGAGVTREESRVGRKRDLREVVLKVSATRHRPFSSVALTFLNPTPPRSLQDAEGRELMKAAFVYGFQNIQTVMSKVKVSSGPCRVRCTHHPSPIT